MLWARPSFFRSPSFLIGLALLASTACSDRSVTAPREPTRPSTVQGPASQAALEAQINGLINALYAPTAQGAVFSSFAKIKAALASGRTADAQAQMVSFFAMVLQDWQGGRLQDPNGSQPPTIVDALHDLLNNVAQFGGLPAPIPAAGALQGGGAVAFVGAAGGTVVAPTGFGGVRFPPGALPSDVIVIITRLPNPTQARTGPLPTTQDQYPLFYDFSTFPHVQRFAQPVTVGLCRLEVGDVFGPPNYTVADRLQIAHPSPANPSTVELLQRVEVDFVHCDGVSLSMAKPASQEGHGVGARALALASAVSSSIAKFVLPTPAYAVHAGLGGKTTSFSPFGMVDPGGISPLYGQLAVGNFHGCEITSAGQTWCWGDRQLGQLGNGVIIASNPSIAVPVDGLPSYTAISSHGSHTCGLLANGSAQCWGRGGQNLGTGINTGPIASPVSVLGGPYLEISGGRLSTCAIDIANAAWCWGLNQRGEVGNPAFPLGTATPVAVATNLKFRSIEAGWIHTCALVLDVHPVADTYCWGSGNSLGNGGATDFPTPVLVGGGVKFSHLFAGGTATCGVTDILTAYCWGFNPSGALGNGTTVDTPIPTPVAGNLSFEMLSTGTRPNSTLTHSCGITLNGVAYCWGANDLGQLGDGTTTGKLVPTPVATAERFVAIGTGDTFSCAMRADRQVFCWGDNGLGQLGNGVAGGISTTPVPVAIGGTPPPPAIGIASINDATNAPANLSALHGAISITLVVNPPFGTTTSSVELVSGTGTVLASQSLTTTQHAAPVLTFNTSQMPLGPGSLQARLFLVGTANAVGTNFIPVNITP